MAMKRCPVCGERYSDTYKDCPFCEEEELWEEEEPRRSGRGGRRSSQFSLVTPILLVLIALMSALLIYLLYGDQIAGKLGGDKDPDGSAPGVTQPVEPNPGGSAGGSEPSGGAGEPSGGGSEPAGSTDEPSGGAGEPAGSTDAPGGVMPEGPEQGASGSAGDAGGSAGTAGGAGSGGSSYAALSQLPGGLTLSNPDFTRSNFGRNQSGEDQKSKLEGVYKADREADPSPVTGFTFDANPVKTELANCSAVISEFVPVLSNGAGDPAELLPQFLSRLENAGIDTIIAEKQAQLDAWKAANN